MDTMTFLTEAKRRGVTKEQAAIKMQEYRQRFGMFDDDPGQPPPAPPTPVTQPEQPPLQQVGARFAQDVRAADATQEPILGQMRRFNALARVGSGAVSGALETIAPEPVKQAAGQALSTVGNFARAPLLEKAGAALHGSMWGRGMDAISQNPYAQEAGKMAANIAAMVPIGKGAQLAGTGIAKATQVSAKPIAELAVKQANLKNISKGKIQSIIQSTGETVATGKVNRPGIPFMKELSEAESRIMKEPRAQEVLPFTEYAKQAEIAKKNTRAITPQQLAGTNASKAFTEIDALRKQTGETIGQILETHPAAKVDISDVKKEYINLVEKRLGIKPAVAKPPKLYDANGKIIERPKQPVSVVSDPSALPIHNDILSTLKELPDIVDAKMAQALKQNLRSKLKYDVSGQYRPANTKMSAIQKQISSQIDKKLDDVLPGFSEANKIYGQTLDVEDAFSRALGAEFIEGSGLTKHGASIMKRALQSNADSNIGDIFREVKRLTNGKYDLFQDASYANIAMRLSGDPNQWQKAMPFGGLIQSGGGITDKALNVAGKINEKGKLRRISNWYEKQHNIPVKLSNQSGFVGTRYKTGNAAFDRFLGKKLTPQMEAYFKEPKTIAEMRTKIENATPAQRSDMIGRLKKIYGTDYAPLFGTLAAGVGVPLASLTGYEMYKNKGKKLSEIGR